MTTAWKFLCNKKSAPSMKSAGEKQYLKIIRKDNKNSKDSKPTKKDSKS